ncbi:MAG: GFA family protein [Gammaproteobacteria bacterium]|nr:GFA family protein [Gammaproteobacteria bacterium]
MSEKTEAKGSCLCGAVNFTAKQRNASVGACHCNMCRKWGGGPLMAIDCGTEVVFDDDSAVAVFVSSDWADRGFCNKCGSHLFYRLKGANQYFMPAGLFEDANKLIFDHQVFIDEKPAYYQFANKTEDMTGAELFAKYAPPPE